MICWFVGTCSFGFTFLVFAYFGRLRWSFGLVCSFLHGFLWLQLFGYVCWLACIGLCSLAYLHFDVCSHLVAFGCLLLFVGFAFYSYFAASERLPAQSCLLTLYVCRYEFASQLICVRLFFCLVFYMCFLCSVVSSCLLVSV